MRSRVNPLDLRLNFYALTVAILAKCSLETAFEKLQSDHPDQVKAVMSAKDTEDMRKFRATGLEYTTIAGYYDAPWVTVYGRLRDRKSRSPRARGLKRHRTPRRKEVSTR